MNPLTRKGAEILARFGKAPAPAPAPAPVVHAQYLAPVAYIGNRGGYRQVGPASFIYWPH